MEFAKGGRIPPKPEGDDSVHAWLTGGCDYVIPPRGFRRVERLADLKELLDRLNESEDPQTSP